MRETRTRCDKEAGNDRVAIVSRPKGVNDGTQPKEAHDETTEGNKANTVG